ncbi:MAG: glycosyltransferase [Lutibacter sp.]|uniref:glycosyltransferase n=1 Tax=Lutibacter sp. TaxID=1925666 RepID=UPI00299D9DB3|nr:glycosyltransferase [Lutibacter sp.]MDX1829034.1 glycosyltransferase [Lutibacter sp.]
MNRVIVSVTNDLVTDQRVHKICSTLSQNNYEIILIGRQFSNSKKLERKYKTYRFKLLFNKGPFFYAEYNIRLLFKILISKPSILLANDLDTLLANFLASKILRKKLVYDSHELFTEVPELIHRPFIQNIWLYIEKFIVPKLKNCVTVSNSISEYYNSIYHTKFIVIRNLPFVIKKQRANSFPFKTDNQKIILYQGAINKGRGLELMIDTMIYLEDTIFVIIGNGDIEISIKHKIAEKKLQKKVRLIDRLEPEELKQLTPLADIGISLEENLGLNYKYALPNKLFDYIQAKIPILVSDLYEMKNITSKYKVGEVVENRNPELLAKQIQKILEKGKIAYKIQLEIAASELNWENESKKLIEIYNKLG